MEDDYGILTVGGRATYFNPRPPCGGRLCFCHKKHLLRIISIHVLRVEDDQCPSWGRICITISIHVLRVEDDTMTDPNLLTADISIHVLRVEDDMPGHYPGMGCFYFNPRPPCGGRLSHNSGDIVSVAFQSTSSVWRTTTRLVPRLCFWPAFQSTSSMWRTTQMMLVSNVAIDISIHVLHVEDD